MQNILTNGRDLRYQPLHLLFQVPEVATGHLAGDKRGEGAHVLRYGHFVIIENDNQVFLKVAGLIERLKGHATGQGAVTDYRDGMVLSTGQVGRSRHAKGCGYGSGGVTDP